MPVTLVHTTLYKSRQNFHNVNRHYLLQTNRNAHTTGKVKTFRGVLQTSMRPYRKSLLRLYHYDSRYSVLSITSKKPGEELMYEIIWGKYYWTHWNGDVNIYAGFQRMNAKSTSQDASEPATIISGKWPVESFRNGDSGTIPEIMKWEPASFRNNSSLFQVHENRVYVQEDRSAPCIFLWIPGLSLTDRMTHLLTDKDMQMMQIVSKFFYTLYHFVGAVLLRIVLYHL